MSDNTIDFPRPKKKTAKGHPKQAAPAPTPAREKPPHDPDRFHGQKLAPFSGTRRVLASKMGMRILSAGEDTWMAFQTRGLYDQILADSCLCVWICLQPQGVILRGMVNPGKSAAEFAEWLDKNNWHTYDASLQSAFTHLIGPMLEQVKDGASASMIEEEPITIRVGTKEMTGHSEEVKSEDGTISRNVTLTNTDADPLGIGIGDGIDIGDETFAVVEIDRMKVHTIYTVE